MFLEILSARRSLYSTFASPWAEIASRRDPEFRLPSCYYMPSSPNAAAKIQYFTDDTLFYIFYAFPRDSLQEMAALQLYVATAPPPPTPPLWAVHSCPSALLVSFSYARNWRYHKDRRVWLTRDPSMDLIEKSDVFERGWYIVFDVNTWEKVRKELTVRYDMLEEKKLPGPGAAPV